MTTVLLVGATGLVGSHVLTRALAEDRIERIVAPTRRPLAIHQKLINPVVDFARLPTDAEWWSVDSAICALGTTRAKTGSVEAYRAIDHDYPLAVAQLIRMRGAARFALTSSMGANSKSRLRYTRTKGELEDALDRLGFPSLTLVRPSLIGGNREEFRMEERVATMILRTFGPLLPKRYRISPALQIARVLVDDAIDESLGRKVIEADHLV